MQEKLKQLKTEALLALKSIKDKAQLEELEVRFLGRKGGELTELLKGLKDLSDDAKREVGQLANEVKTSLEEAVSAKKKEFSKIEMAGLLEKESLDISQPALPPKSFGHLHPNTIIQNDLEDFFTSMGFMVLDGPELESEYYNFSALNIPPDHPARDMQDTFYIKNHTDWVMRTHTSPVQVRAMQKYGAPLRMIVPGKCFRNEATDVRHEHTFYQLEGVVIDKDISFAHMKGVLESVAKHLYGPDTKINMRPKFYPFVEPGVNLEVTCFVCQGKGCRLCKQSGWLEIGGAGMIHPNVLRESGIDTKVNQGFAFGFGLTRLVMLKYGIEDVRLLESGNMKFLEQF
ncbi:MAG: phenylalanine--tRNA ligase subunit alpha [Candidatus Magasanikbacteria bacterium RIFOXYD2_FULL_39_9]|uniref:Phenylalanine--tRNA ligase alpha subunit n=1 Tax=Candidatus Magasanikbacteria bacterium RIFOXYD1_FULL_40_23 TaxID=1798705 RepID=A0A1F6P9A2_9BACT|nr:MAG: phenylalanine--tRNA ligase subunit alpha [Candidatus Magasanikbacteria bacterium RIFOXYD1_FULL_40_23]OGH93447.1 MAG: phenylalanine--tRNA ligase subunit alpha [Candidatus Magasanikbacteria bacterium RIFOXYD2_FULL_39_9]